MFHSGEGSRVNSSCTDQLRKLECFRHALVIGGFNPRQALAWRCRALALLRAGRALLSLVFLYLPSCELFLVRLTSRYIIDGSRLKCLPSHNGSGAHRSLNTA